jgi:hypothetical protein
VPAAHFTVAQFVAIGGAGTVMPFGSTTAARPAALASSAAPAIT